MYICFYHQLKKKQNKKQMELQMIKFQSILQSKNSNSCKLKIILHDSFLCDFVNLGVIISMVIIFEKCY